MKAPGAAVAVSDAGVDVKAPGTTVEVKKPGRAADGLSVLCEKGIMVP